ncbi:MAG: hypothetical protein HYU25_17955 [Candidatus Rokubacteria bacterium]|nr:hypothetical protein [Candidatus Rokubacteria bacterium]
MKIVLSRKGFDSAAGAVPNPILPDGRVLMLPIPDRCSRIRYDEILARTDGYASLYEVIRDLGGRVKPEHGAHLDPDLDAGALRSRPDGWRPAFGQSGAALGHLRREDVGPGDLFLFFGRCRQVVYRHGRVQYADQVSPLHLLFGWLQVGTVVDLKSGPVPDWLTYHPNVTVNASVSYGFVAADELTLFGERIGVAGAGQLGFSQNRVLTDPGDEGGRISRWALPEWFYPDGGRKPLSYHGDPRRWRRGADGGARLSAVGRGQEFVLDTVGYPRDDVVAWVRGLLGRA